ncbi:hypothetical protein B0E42_10590 [Pseudomonas sp. A25(2017)]|nr:hypothetical protein B0E42_10590 [Pseudomonas sp. A25(2017)]
MNVSSGRVRTAGSLPEGLWGGNTRGICKCSLYVGAKLARDDGVKFDTYAEYQAAIASKLCSHKANSQIGTGVGLGGGVEV